MLGRIYCGEFKKLFRLKTIIIMALIIIAVFVITAFSYNEIVIELTRNLQEIPGYSGQTIKINDKNEAEALIAVQEKMKKESSEFDWLSSTPYIADSNIAVIRYIMDNNLYGQDVKVYSSGSDLTMGKPSAEGFYSLFLSILSLALSIYALSVGSGIFSREIKEGTLKMMFMRPITRPALVTAKLLASLTVVVGLLCICSLAAYIYGLIAYGAAPVTELVYVLNASYVFKAPSTFGSALPFISELVSLIALTILTFSISTLTKSRIAGMAIGLVIVLGVVQLVAMFLKFSAFLLSTSLDWAVYFGLGASVPLHGSFYLAIGMIFVYLVPLVVATYLVFNKRDIA